MPWWAWIVVGAFLLASELALIDAQFYLVFFGRVSVAGRRYRSGRSRYS